MIWNAAAALFASEREADNHDALGGVLTHENAIHLYKSPESHHVVQRQVIDYGVAGFFAAWLSGVSFAVMPLFVLATGIPRKMTTMHYFVFQAELLPHTEQVVFTKVDNFGETTRYVVDIRNLEKIDGDQVDAPLMWQINMFDADLVFRDAASGEVFVFDKNGLWNKEALEHELLY